MLKEIRWNGEIIKGHARESRISSPVIPPPFKGIL
jgi:hypothetical protein